MIFRAIGSANMKAQWNPGDSFWFSGHRNCYLYQWTFERNNGRNKYDYETVCQSRQWIFNSNSSQQINRRHFSSRCSVANICLHSERLRWFEWCLIETCTFVARQVPFVRNNMAERTACIKSSSSKLHCMTSTSLRRHRQVVNDFLRTNWIPIFSPNTWQSEQNQSYMIYGIVSHTAIVTAMIGWLATRFSYSNDEIWTWSHQFMMN